MFDLSSNKHSTGDESTSLCYCFFSSQINGIPLHGRSHLNASAIIKGIQEASVKIVLLRLEIRFYLVSVKLLA